MPNQMKAMDSLLVEYSYVGDGRDDQKNLETIQHYLIKTELNDSKNIAKLTFGLEGTFNGFHIDKPVTRRIYFC
ncbi:hypothetical protein [Winogradskyella marina]|uniref:hypothetical protein n=1 Tax=Winogradskyella marina TaxID=2785530 RepID=UPI001E65B90C|nr:hypothetical protein [Winogradskyella marina]